MPKIYIDGQEYQIKEGMNMLEAVLSLGLNLPYFCWHPAMHSVGACRQCAVKVFKDESDKKGKILMSCMTPAVDGSRFSINDPEAVEFRRYVIEWLMTNHPHDCPVCDEGGECHLQDMTAMCGHVYRRFRNRKRTYNNQYLGPFVNHEMNRCIQCWRCVRFYVDHAGGKDFNVFGSKNRVYFGRQEDGILESEFSGNLVEVCPTGVFTDKTLKKHYTRKWDLQTAPSICIHCGLGCNTIPGERYRSLRRIRARYNPEVNGYFICDRGRYGYEFVNHEIRLRQCRVEGQQKPWEVAIEHAKILLSKARGVIGIGSPRASLESNYALKQLVGEGLFSTGLSAFEKSGVEAALEILKEGPTLTPSLAEVGSSGAVLILGADPTNEAPMLDFWLRQGINKARLDISRALKIPDWDAHAVATALQEARGKLHIIGPWSIKLKEIAVRESLMSYADTAYYAAASAEKLHSGDHSNPVVADLLEVDKPLIVTSITAGPDVVRTAANVAWALREVGKDSRLSIIVPEANTMGAAMLGGISVDNALDAIESGQADTLVVLENDLARRASPEKLRRAIGKVKAVIVLDCIESTARWHPKPDILLAVPTYIETDGTFINNECRAQRFYQVFVPRGEIIPAWRILAQLQREAAWKIYEDVLRELAMNIPALAPALEAAPFADWRSPANRKVARMPHRYSGRTAMDANVTIDEPRPPDDPDTPFNFSMEGDQNPVPGALEPRFWWPGWNSMNAVTKFQIEVNGPLHGGNPGKRLVEPGGKRTAKYPEPRAHRLEKGQVWLVPRPRIFGSEELSIFSPGIAELAAQPEISMHPETAGEMGIGHGEVADIETGERTIRLKALMDDGICKGIAVIPAGLPETLGITLPVPAKIVRVE